MKQYLDLLQRIKAYGVYKPSARQGMPGTTSLFGYQMRFNLKDGFPILTTKKVSFKNIVVELLWFLKGNTNIKFLDENNCTKMWHEDAYQYYCKIAKANEPNMSLIMRDNGDGTESMYTFEEFCEVIRTKSQEELNLMTFDGYTFGDCGKQYGWLWRNWGTGKYITIGHDGSHNQWEVVVVDQISELIDGLVSNPMGRRHIITAWNPTTLNDMALNACHAFVQFNCRPLTKAERVDILIKNNYPEHVIEGELVDEADVPKYYLDCQMYQRSADSFLGVPYNITSYALLTEILAQMCNMVAGEFIHTFGDVHIYDNHDEQTDLQLTRTPSELPKLLFKDEFHYEVDAFRSGDINISEFINNLKIDSFALDGYNPQEAIKGKLSTGLK